jgi:hypothetical protein
MGSGVASLKKGVLHPTPRRVPPALAQSREPLWFSVMDKRGKVSAKRRVRQFVTIRNQFCRDVGEVS